MARRTDGLRVLRLWLLEGLAKGGHCSWRNGVRWIVSRRRRGVGVRGVQVGVEAEGHSVMVEDGRGDRAPLADVRVPIWGFDEG